MRRACAGMTLLELLVVMGLLAVLMSLAAPAVANMVNRYRHESIVRSVWMDLALARSEAIRQGSLVAMCASRGDGTCASEAHWSVGRMLFVDKNANGHREDHEQVIARREAVPAGWRLAGNSPVKRYVAYHPSGRTVQAGGALQMGTLTICGRNPDQMAHQIVINAAGRPRLKRSDGSVCS